MSAAAKVIDDEPLTKLLEEASDKADRGDTIAAVRLICRAMNRQQLELFDRRRPRPMPRREGNA